MSSGDDFYSGFEGEPEIRFTYAGKDGSQRAVRIWIGYFDAIMNRVEPDNGIWRGLALPYHLNEGWYVENPWQIPSLNAVIDQWQSVDIEALKDTAQAVHIHVLALLKDAHAHNAVVWIEYD
ncbi:hypothetical protein [Microvirga sp. Mcv34]|uniref:hypothetical protein n=1 Tax=Microvirga sp. Mcv34 TaxID=2926016 RepID=UPI0021CA9333|nr:hypothetical protein [Microvirga sp. Mcv34]